MTETLARIAVTRIGKVVLAVWGLALALLVGLPIAGAFQGEFLGNLAFVILPVGILVNISVILAHYLESGSVRIAKAGWIGAAIVSLLIVLYGFDGKTNSDIWIVLTWSMLVLSFPAGLLVSLARIFLPVSSETSYLSLTLEWGVYTALGYWQWFVLLPWLWRTWKARRLAGTAPSH